MKLAALKAKLTTKDYIPKSGASMRIPRIIFIFLSIFLLILSTVNAVEILSKSVSEPLCPRETGLFSHLIRNNGNAIKDYNVNVIGSASQWSTVVPAQFILAPGEEENIFTYVTPSQSAEPGDYNINIEVSAPEESRRISHNVRVKDCYSASIVAVPNALGACPSDAIRYRVILTNNGELAETFRISVGGGLADGISLSDDVAILRKGESKNILVFVNSPVEAGEYNFNLIIESQSGRIKESLPLFLRVNPCYDFAFNVGGSANNSYSMCDRSIVNVPLNLRNTGTALNGYRINVEGPIWARPEKNEFTLKDKEAKTFNLVFAPTYGVNGDYNVKLTVTPERGSLKFVSDFAVQVRRCHSVAVEFSGEPEQDVCKGAVNRHEVTVINDGEKRKTYRVGLDGPDWVNFVGQEIITLNPMDKTNFTILASPGGDVEEQRYALTFRAVPADESGEVIFDEDELIVDVKDSDSCFRPRLDAAYADLVIYFDSGIAVPIDVRNDGVKPAQFTLSLNGSAAGFSRFGSSVLDVEPGRSQVVYLYIAPTIDTGLGNYDAIVSLNLKDGPLLLTKEFNIEITDQRERATVISPVVGIEQPAVERQSFWSRVRGWFRRVFIGEENFAYQSTSSNLISDNISGDQETGIEAPIGEENGDILSEEQNESEFVPASGTIYPPREESTSSESTWSRFKNLARRTFIGENQTQNLILNPITPLVNTNPSESKLSSYKYWILGVVIVVLVIILLIQLGLAKRAIKYLREDD